MRRSIKKQLPKSGRKDEIRRPDVLSKCINGKLGKPFSAVGKANKFIGVAGTIITIGMSIYGLVPKTDKLPLTDNQRSDMM